MSYCVVRDSASGRLDLVSILTPGSGAFIGASAAVDYATLSPDGQYFVLPTSVAPYIRVFRTEDCSLVPLPTQKAVSASSDTARWIGSDYLLIEYSDKTWTMYRTSDWSVAYSDALTTRTYSYISPANTHVVSLFSVNPRVRILDVATGVLYGLSSETISSAATYLENISPDGRFVAVMYTVSPWFRVYDMATRSIVASGSSRITACKFSPDSAYFSTLGYASPYPFSVIATSNWSSKGSMNTPGNYNYCKFSFSGTYAVATGSTGIEIRRTANWSLVKVVTGYSLSALVTLFPDSDRMIVFSTAHAAVVDLETGNETILANSASRSSAQFFPAIAQFHLEPKNSTAEPVYSAATLEQVATLSLGGFSANGILIAPNNDAVVYKGNFDWRVFSLPDWGAIVPRITSTTYTSQHFTPDGALLFCVDGGAGGIFRSHLYRQTGTGWEAVYENGSWGRDSPVLAPLFGEAFTVSGQVLGTDGSSSVERVCMFPANDPSMMVTTMTDGNGQFTFSPVGERTHVALIADQREKVHKINPAIFEASRTGDPVEIVLRLSNAGNKYPISGNATKASGAAVDSVSVFEWSTSEISVKVIPAINGDWTAAVPTGEYGLLYLADGCAPVTHGPYTVSES